jgi:hypothetical protein
MPHTSTRDAAHSLSWVPNCSISRDAIAMQNDSSRKPSRNYRPWSWVIQPARSLSRPQYPYPHEDEFELKERKHFEWYDSQSSIEKDLSASSRPNRPLSYPFAPEPLYISRDVSALPPDGGRVAWLHTLAGFLVILNAQGLNMAFGVFQAYYEKVLLPTTASSKIAWIGSVQIFFVFGMALLVSPAAQHGHFRLYFSGGSVVLCLSILGTSYCTNWWQLFVAQGLMTGMAMGTIFASGVAVLISYFTSHLNVATGIAAAGGPAGGILFPLIAKNAIPSIGFGGTLRLIALINLLTMSVANLIVRERRAPQTGISLQRTDPRKSESVFKDAAYLSMMLGMFFTYSEYP